MIQKIELVIKNFLTKKTLGPGNFNVEPSNSRNK